MHQTRAHPGARLAITLAAAWCLSSAVGADQAAGSNQQAPSNPRRVITGPSTRQATSEVEVLRIRFEAGSRTYWHTHAEPQLLLVEEGRGRFQQRGEKIVELRAGESTYAPANVPHWHGAAPDAAATLLTVYPHGVKLTLLDEVTDAEYHGKTQPR